VQCGFLAILHCRSSKDYSPWIRKLSDWRHCFAKFISFLKTWSTDCVNRLSFPQSQPPRNSLSFSLHNETMVAAISEKNQVCTDDLTFGLYNRSSQRFLYHMFGCILNQLKQPYILWFARKTVSPHRIYCQHQMHCPGILKSCPTFNLSSTGKNLSSQYCLCTIAYEVKVFNLSSDGDV